MVIVLLYILYVIGRYQVKPEVTIVQTSIERLTDDIILERNPVVIEDDVVDSEQVIQNSFKYLFVTKNDVDALSAKNKHQYLVFHNNSGSSQSVVIENKVNVILHKGNILILPLNWKYHMKNKIKMTGLHSITSFLFSFA